MSPWLGEPGPPSPVEEMSFLLSSEHTVAPSAELFTLDSRGRWGWGCGVMQAPTCPPSSSPHAASRLEGPGPRLPVLSSHSSCSGCPSLNEPQASSLEPNTNHCLGFPALLPGAWEGYMSRPRRARLGRVMLGELKGHLSLQGGSVNG